MISSANHHHQNLAHGQDFTLPGTLDLVQQHNRLETLLDSALATCMLIHNATSPPAFSPHILGVLALLGHHIAYSSPLSCHYPADSTENKPPPVPSDTTLPTTTSDTSSDLVADHAAQKTATYADVTRDSSAKPPLPRTPKADHVRQDAPSSLIIRFDNREVKPFPARALDLFNALSLSLVKVFGDDHASITSAHWSRKGNLILHPNPNICTARSLAQHSEKIWSAIRPLLELPADYDCPVFDTDERWHSVVFHGVPMPLSHPPRAYYSSEMVEKSLIHTWAIRVKHYSLLTRPEKFETRRTLTMKISLSSLDAASYLIRNGGFMAGTWCRVTPYEANHRRPCTPANGAQSPPS
ncbi:hypothetical protein R3P38DRAFT_3334311 [Favolaschia claudopus]|uniref:Uncharacterized protein n=1 Tax=Favolaschia claudopus TaxID=2862362 RepID=A0AAV9ZE69_9AGAR